MCTMNGMTFRAPPSICSSDTLHATDDGHGELHCRFDLHIEV